MQKPQNYYDVVSFGAKKEQFYNSYANSGLMDSLNAYGGKDITNSRQYMNDYISLKKQGKELNPSSTNFSFGKK